MDLLPGFLQGLTRVVISYPFDYIRTNIQTQNHLSIQTYIKLNNITFKNAYRGCSLQLVSVPIERSIQFFLFEHFLKNYSVFESSIISSLMSSIYSVPVNLLTTKIVTKNCSLTYDSIYKFVINKKYYTGYVADFSKTFYGAVIYTTLYGNLRQHINKNNHNYFLFGVISGIGCWCCIYPFDTLRVIKQTSNKSYTDIIKNISFIKLYVGFSLVLARSIPSAGCGMYVYI